MNGRRVERARTRARVWFLCLAMGLAACRPQVLTPGEPEPRTRRVPPAGPVVGMAHSYDSDAWLGIPYALPPVGERRWRAPEPAPRWAEERVATQFGPPCVQYASAFGGVPGRAGTVQGSEDCLTLNIWAPRFTPAELETAPRLPVMVWIHGGGNTIGTARFYVGGHLASAGRVIVVTVQYRLGPLGWFRHPALRAEARDAVEAAGNFGTLDLIRALEWVQENIAAFGGDPGNVTIFGESAGGTNVFSLLLSPQARGLFHRAIVQSGGLRFAEPGQADFPASEGGDPNGGAEVVLRFWTARTGSREAAQATIAKMPPHELATALRSLPAEELLQLFRPEPTGMIRMPLVFRDGTVLPGEAPEESLRSGRFHPVPLLVGTNRDEAKLFLAVDRDLVTYRLWVLPRVRDQHLYALIAGYLSRLWKARGADEPAQAISQHAGTRVFVYRFDWDEEPRFWGTDLAFLLGAAHGLEIPFVFGHFDLGRLGNRLFTHENLEGRIALSEAMLSYWAAFAAAGNPGRGLTGHRPDWLPWDPAAPRFLVLDTPAGGGIRMESGMETRAAILDQLANDPRVRSARERCIVYRYLVETRNLSQREYESLEVCRDFPLSAYPWQ